jgi:hypothetical protein
MSETYCGIKPLKKNQHRGTMIECSQRGKIGYYGFKLIDPKTYETYRSRGMNSLTTYQIWVKLSVLRAKIMRLRREIQNAKDKKKKDKLVKDEKKSVLLFRKIQKIHDAREKEDEKIKKRQKQKEKDKKEKQKQKHKKKIKNNY